MSQQSKRGGVVVVVDPDPELEEFGRFDLECWETAREQHEKTLNQTTKRLQSFKVHADHLCSADALLKSAANASTKFQDRRRPLPHKFLSFTRQLTRHSKSIDVLAQLHPFVPAVWGSVRLILDVINDEEAASNILVEGIHQVSLHLDRWQQIASVFTKSETVRASLVDLYEAVLDFLATATLYLQKTSWRRLGKSSLYSAGDKFKGKVDKVKSAGKLLDKVVGTLAIKTQDRNSTTLLGLMNTMSDRFDRMEDRMEEEIAGRREMIYDLRSDPSFWTRRPCPSTESDMDIMSSWGTEQDPSHVSSIPAWLEKSPLCVSLEDGRFPFQGTGEWLASNKQVASWRDGKILKPLWIQGKPGSGKSYCFETLVKHLQGDKEKLVLSHSLQNFSDPQCSNLSSLAASVLVQLIRASERPYPEPILNILRDLARTYPKGPRFCPFQRLWPVIVEIFKLGAHGRKFFLIIDALDECRFGPPSPKVREFLSELRKPLDHSVRVAIFSRPTFGSIDFAEHCESIHIDQGLNAHDIQLYVSELLMDTIIPPEYREAIQNQVAIRAEGLFLWARVFVEQLEQICEEDTFMERLYHSPRGLWEFWDKITQEQSSRMSSDDKLLRQILFELLCGAGEPLHQSAVAKWLKIGRWDQNVPAVLARIGGPLIEVKHCKVRFIHHTVEEWATDESRCPLHSPTDTLFVGLQVSQARLAKECLGTLSREEYASKWKIGQYLHRNFLVYEMVSSGQEVGRESVEYTYAAQYWKHHLIHVFDPDRELLDLFRNFLVAFQFAHWSQYVLYNKKNDHAIIRATYNDLKDWFRRLPDDKKRGIDVDGYYVYSYFPLIAVYKEDLSQDRELPWLASISLARFFIDIGVSERAISVLVETTEALSRLLGPRHPLTMQAMTYRAVLYLQQGEFRQANKDFADLVRIQEEDSGLDNTELFKNLLNRGVTEYLMNQYPEAIASIDKAALGFLKLIAVDDTRYQTTQVSLSDVLIQIGMLERPLNVLERLLEERWKAYGRGDIFASRVQYSIGDIYRKQGRKSESLAYIRESLTTRKKSYPLSSIWTLDVSISLLIALRDFGLRQEALGLLNDIDKHANLDPSSPERRHLYPRYCQVNHLRALLYSDGGKKTEAISLLQGLLIHADRELYNRALMWIILDLAVLLRARGKPGDKEQAEANFNHVVRTRSADDKNAKKGGIADTDSIQEAEPDPPRLLRFAEQVLLLVRARKFDQVEKLFEKQKLEWFRSEDIWITYGSPAADTAWMKGP